ncbi:MAG: MBL fold metallo-hydrolase [Methanomicrobium sp.]|nr:MBL fold metallo-hydrolase [Methanomicrobium sp.]
MLTITEVYNNISCSSNLISDFGFACFFKEAGLLFDTGAKEDILLKNLASLNIVMDDIRAVFLSHDHWDHNGGLSISGKFNKNVKSFALDSFSKETLEILSKNTDLHIVSCWEEIMPGIFSTGPLGDDVTEQSVAVKTGDGFVVISGCSHPHIETVLCSVRQKGKVAGVIGGLHDVSDSDIGSLSGISYLAPSHCTKRLLDIKSAYTNNFRNAGLGCSHIFL